MRRSRRSARTDPAWSAMALTVLAMWACNGKKGAPAAAGAAGAAATDTATTTYKVASADGDVSCPVASTWTNGYKQLNTRAAVTIVIGNADYDKAKALLAAACEQL